MPRKKNRGKPVPMTQQEFFYNESQKEKTEDKLVQKAKQADDANEWEDASLFNSPQKIAPN